MVDVLMLASLGDTNLDALLALSQEFDVVKKERTQSFFSNRTIYDATAFTQTNGNGDEAAYLGHVIVGPNGRLGFDPSVVLAGDVAGGSIHDFLVEEIAAHHDADTVWANLMSGEDVVIGNGVGSYIQGYDGDDVLLNDGPGAQPGSNGIYGGAGDDLIFLAGAYAYGETGADRFVANAGFFIVEDLEHGIDKILLDRTIFADVGSRVTKDNFHVGPAAADADDRLIASQLNPDENRWRIFVDPDGVGGVDQQYFGFVVADHKLTFRDFGMVDAAKLMPDISKLFDMGAQPLAGPRIDHAFGVDHTAVATDLTHHGLIQLV